MRGRLLLPLAFIPLIIGVVLALWLNLVGGNLVYVAMTQVDDEWVFDLRDADFENNFYKLHGGVPMPSSISMDPPFISPARFDDYLDLVDFDFSRHFFLPAAAVFMYGGWNTSRLRILLPEDEWVSFSRVSISKHGLGTAIQARSFGRSDIGMDNYSHFKCFVPGYAQ